jgi:hypothetical protein
LQTGDGAEKKKPGRTNLLRWSRPVGGGCVRLCFALLIARGVPVCLSLVDPVVCSIKSTGKIVFYTFDAIPFLDIANFVLRYGILKSISVIR